MLTWERYHHNNDLEWPIRPDGANMALLCCILMEDSGVILLEGSDPEVLTPVTWDAASYFNVVESGGTISRKPVLDFPVNKQCLAYTVDTIDADREGFEFEVPIPNTPGVITIGLNMVPPFPAIDCGNNARSEEHTSELQSPA